MSKPVILGAVFINGFLYACRNRDFVIKFNDLFGTFDYPREDTLTGIGIEVFRVVLLITGTFDLGVKRDHNKPAPYTIVRSADTRQVIGIEYQCMAGRK